LGGDLQRGMGSALSEVTNRTLEKPLMTTSPRVVKSPVEELPADLVQLQSTIDALPAEYRSQLSPLVTRVIESTRRRRRIMNLVQEALSQLRLDMKYLLFDLEATRRERDELRRQAEGDGE
jgi:hypothetical protein